MKHFTIRVRIKYLNITKDLLVHSPYSNIYIIIILITFYGGSSSGVKSILATISSIGEEETL